MTTYEVQTLETAPEKSRGAMQRLKSNAGMIPNLAAMMSTSPTLIEAFVTLREIFQAGTLDAKERETLGLANAIENGCEWCVAFHSFVALKVGVDAQAVEHLRGGGQPDDARLRALTRFTQQLIAKRGKLGRGDARRLHVGRLQQGPGARSGGRPGGVAHGKLRRQFRASGTGGAVPGPALVAPCQLTDRGKG